VATRRPNFLFIMSDDHAAHAISAYGSRINRTPHLDRIDGGGMRIDSCFCTSSICTPIRAARTGPRTLSSGSCSTSSPIPSELAAELARLQSEVGDEPHPAAVPA
jgi:arylsulfatase A-like enzyme